MSFTPQELHILQLYDRKLSNQSLRGGKPGGQLKPLTGDDRIDARRRYRREWMRNHRKQQPPASTPTPATTPTKTNLER
jgi:hypothetical protein